MRFAIFDQMESVDRPLNEVYADRLRLLEAADEAGFWCYLKSEHHLTPLDTAPSISSWLAAVAARTSRIRIGSMVYLLPFHHPLRLLEEIAMLDHLSNGRLEVGVGRGISPPEHQMWGLEPEVARDRSDETLEVLLAGMTNQTLNFEGRFWNFQDVPIEVRPLQTQHPPLWYPGIIEVAGSRGFNTFTAGAATNVAVAAARFAELNAEYANAPGRVNGAGTPTLGAGTLRVFVAEDAQVALARARIAWKHFDANLTKLWRRAGITELPMNPTADGDFDLAAKKGVAFAGTPAMLSERLNEYSEVGIDLVMLGFDWGNLEAKEVRRSLDLVVEHVMPDFDTNSRVTR
ncbi:MAG: alkanesulfonate monooxygenase SsuD [Candidatus Poriferisodalaceae bacterium]|jgi:alkanesulfonate monooxygenase SsuD/methylene tetrahydromethanopterin reductase-like flavin-dependent oxidoreductase (luciferase family)